ncbi:MAG: metallophosphoesterase [Ruminococcus sp.]|nr:metallophosphoesterase [Ruminococcus sp.]
MKKVALKIFLCLIIIFVLIYLDARYINTVGLKVNEIPIYTETLSADYNGFKIAHFSDLLYGSTTNKDTLKEVVTKLNELNADIIIFTGDLFSYDDIKNETSEEVINELSNIKAKLYKFAIIGDNDQKYLSTYEEILNKSYFILLDNSNKLVYNNSSTPLNFIGLTNTDNMELYNNDYFNITLTHYPDTIKKLDNTSLVFAGHSLGGQIRIPFIGGLIKTEGAKSYLDSYYEINSSKLYISNGLGTTNLKLRLFNKPSITLYRLYNS